MDTGTVFVLLAGIVVALGGSMALTWLGQRRRGRGQGVALVASVFFPITWAVWYVADERPFHVS